MLLFWTAATSLNLWEPETSEKRPSSAKKTTGRCICLFGGFDYNCATQVAEILNENEQAALQAEIQRRGYAYFGIRSRHNSIDIAFIFIQESTHRFLYNGIRFVQCMHWSLHIHLDDKYEYVSTQVQVSTWRSKQLCESHHQEPALQIPNPKGWSPKVTALWSSSRTQVLASMGGCMVGAIGTEALQQLPRQGHN